MASPNIIYFAHGMTFTNSDFYPGWQFDEP